MMADRPDVYPDWALEEETDPVSGQLNRVEPPSERKDSGWTRREIPPRQWWNWLWWKNGQWLRWIEERISDSTTAFLRKSQNLSDLDSASTARNNLDVYSKSEVDQTANRSLNELTGSSTTINSSYDGVYYWSNTGGHTVTIGQESSDEGATVTRLICRSGSDSNLTLSLASGVTANWSFMESESAAGYEIKPGESVELVKVGSNSYIAYAPNGVSEVLEITSSDFDPGQSVMLYRNGDQVTLTFGLLEHPDNGNPQGDVLPVIFQAELETGNLYNHVADVMMKINVKDTSGGSQDGSFSFIYTSVETSSTVIRDYTGASSSITYKGR